MSAKTATACERVLGVTAVARARDEGLEAESKEYQLQIAETWKGSDRLTPRQAAALSTVLSVWSDEINYWLEGVLEGHPKISSGPLSEAIPFAIDPRVMMLIGENFAWAGLAKDHCAAISDEIEAGQLPFDRPNCCYFDEAILGIALQAAEDSLNDQPEIYQHIPPRTTIDLSDADDEDAGYLLGDDDWGSVRDHFDNDASWGDWDVLMYSDHPLMRYLLTMRHPFTWFDPRQPGQITDVFHELQSMSSPPPKTA